MRALRSLLAASAALVLTLAAGGSAQGASILINNGLAPPNPENVIDDLTYYDDDSVYVRNVGCPPAGPPDPDGGVPGPEDAC